MKVKELKEFLAKYDEDLDVILSKDPEGNGYDTLYAAELGMFDMDDKELCPIGGTLVIVLSP